MNIDLELQEKEVFREVMIEGDFETIAVWLDGDWSQTTSPHYQERLLEGEPPIFFITKAQLTASPFTLEKVEDLIQVIEDKLNPMSPSPLEP